MVWLIVWLVVMIICTVLAIGYSKSGRALKKTQEQSTATIIKKAIVQATLSSSTSDGIETNNIIYTWPMKDGSEARFVAGLTADEWNDVKVGETFEVTFLPSNPSVHNCKYHTHTDSADMNIGFALIAFLFLVYCFISGTIRTFRKLRRERVTASFTAPPPLP